MAVNVNFIGRLGLDSEIREGKNGSKYVTFRIATDEYKGNGIRETSWLNVYDYSERALKMAQYWKKGTMLNVIGTETVGVYQSKQTGDWLPSRDIRAHLVEFVNSGSGTANQEGATTATAAVAPTTNTNTANCGTFTPPPAVPSFATTSNSDGDDLPF